MTEFQYSAIKALATSPAAYQAAKLAAINRKGFDQYMNRVWPCKQRMSIVKNRPRKDSMSTIQQKMISIDEKSSINDETDRPISYFIEFSRSEVHQLILSNVKSNTIDPEMNRSARRERYAGEIKIHFYINGHSIRESHGISAYVTIEKKRLIHVDDPTRALKHLLLVNIRNYAQVAVSSRKIGNTSALFINEKDLKKIDCLASIEVSYYSKQKMNSSGFTKLDINKINKRISKQVKENIKSLSGVRYREVIQPKKNKISQNVGIEIEYDGDYLRIARRLKSLGAISFESGRDGESGNRFGNGLRLREARLRINGIYGIKSLEYLLSYMIENGAKHASNSSVHYHIDIRHTDKFAKHKDRVYSTEKAKKREILRNNLFNIKNEKVIEAFIFIFEMNSVAKMLQDGGFDKDLSGATIIQLIMDQIRISDEFDTIEFRFGSKTLIYSKMILQILILIHITNSARYKNKQINEEYILKLCEIAKELY